ncbi:MAG TPA: MOSC N-terminal beta barrel domain-containing protein [Gaiellaceae bacterium]|nr:MOSC N-terminal beta barrel domain-containing protein [Gaiellaceae bacterium]
MSARVAWISLTPVKATALHHVDEVELLESGPEGDRRFYFVDERGRLVNNKDCGPLQLVWADYDAPADTLTMRFADGRVVAGPVERGEEIETVFHGRPRLARLVHGPWAEAVSQLAGEPVRLVEPAHGAADRGRGGAATLVGTASLEALAGTLGVERIDARRFRMNFGIDGLAPYAEDAWQGRRVRIGGAVVIPQGHVGRCVVTTQSPETGRSDLDTRSRPSPRCAAASTPPSRCPSASTPRSPSPAASGSATR